MESVWANVITDKSLDSKIRTGKFSPESSTGELHFSNAVPEQWHEQSHEVLLNRILFSSGLPYDSGNEFHVILTEPTVFAARPLNAPSSGVLQVAC